MSTISAFSPGCGGRATAATVGRNTRVTGHPGHAVWYDGSSKSVEKRPVSKGMVSGGGAGLGTELMFCVKAPESMKADMKRLMKPSERQKARSYGVEVLGIVGPKTGGPTWAGFSVEVIGGASGAGVSAMTFESTLKVMPC